MDQYHSHIDYTYVPLPAISKDNGQFDILTIKNIIQAAPHDINKKYGFFGYTLLYHASESNRLDIVKYLVEFGADVNSTTCIGATPLMVAASYGHINIVKYLLDSGADKEIYGQYVEKASELAKRCPHPEIAEYIESFELVLTKGVHDWP